MAGAIGYYEPLQPRGYVDSSNVDTRTVQGAYYHGSELFSGGTYGILVVFRYSKNVVQFDFSFNGVSQYRASTNLGSSWSELFKLS